MCAPGLGPLQPAGRPASGCGAVPALGLIIGCMFLPMSLYHFYVNLTFS